jgi:membrane protein DedA with SNARE-associated domain
MLISILTIASLIMLAGALLRVPWRYPRVGFVGSMLWTALAGAIYFANAHNPDPWAHLMDDVQHAIGIAVLSYAAVWIGLALAGQAHLHRVGRVGVAATRI